MIDITRARYHFQVREVPFCQLGQLQVSLHVVDGVDQHLGVLGTGGLQQIGAGGITIKHLGIELAQRFNMVRIVIQHHGMYAIGQ
ncbi:hypothetical protein D3C72_1427660 [compost metagenome]